MAGILPQIKPTFPDRQLLKSYIFPSNKLAVIETSFLTHGDCACDQFHFLIPTKQAPVISTENRRHSLKEMSVFPCNPLQLHRIEDTGINDFNAFIIYVENNFLKMIAEELFNRRDLEMKSRAFAYSPALRELMDAFIREHRAGQPGCSLVLESISVQIAVLLLRESDHNLSDSSFRTDYYIDEKTVNKAINYITDNYQNRISLFDIANETNYSPYHFLRLFKRHTGRTPFEFLVDVKIEKAREMLRKTDCTISQICDLCGFSSLSYFSRVFRLKTGITPTQYKNNI